MAAVGAVGVRRCRSATLLGQRKKLLHELTGIVNHNPEGALQFLVDQMPPVDEPKSTLMAVCSKMSLYASSCRSYIPGRCLTCRAVDFYAA